ncbi:hypothetical protein MJO29_015916 [Puccinia striiformis f. sp. tritici]|nr:hypothetical protein MJO29_015916 [Puccinia striiformis f. sp. tritici]
MAYSIGFPGRWETSKALAIEPNRGALPRRLNRMFPYPLRIPLDTSRSFLRRIFLQLWSRTLFLTQLTRKTSIRARDFDPNTSHTHFTLPKKNQQSNTFNKIITHNMVPQGPVTHEPSSVQFSQLYRNLTGSNSISISNNLGKPSKKCNNPSTIS